MTDEEKKATEIQNAEEYVAKIKELKENTVDKKLYEQSQHELAVLRDALIEGISLPENAQEEQKADRSELVKKLIKSEENNLSNAEFVKTALELREAVIADGELDPFLPVGAKIQPTVEDVAKAQRVADGLQHCLDEATDDKGNIDPYRFNSELQRIIADDNPALTMRLAANNNRKGKK